MSKTPVYPVCPVCKYNLAGIPLDDILHTYCPECGEYIKPTSSKTIADQQHAKKRKTTIFAITLSVALIGVCILVAIMFFTLMFVAFKP